MALQLNIITLNHIYNKSVGSYTFDLVQNLWKVSIYTADADHDDDAEVGDGIHNYDTSGVLHPTVSTFLRIPITS